MILSYQNHRLYSSNIYPSTLVYSLELKPSTSVLLSTVESITAIDCVVYWLLANLMEISTLIRLIVII